MKFFLLFSALLFTAANGFSQIMQASIGAGSTATRVKIYVKPTSAVNGTISTLQFNVAIDASITPVPVLSIVNTTTFAVTWNIDPSYVEDGYRHYQFTTSSSPSATIGAGVETEVMELQFSGGPMVPNNVALVTLPGGGLSGNALFYCSGAATSVEGQLYYARTGTTVINNMSYTGLLPSSATVGGILLPINWLSFNVVKQGNDGILNWTVANDQSNHHFELLRSTNGTSFSSIAVVNRSGRNAYTYSDLGINNLGAGVLYYKIKQVDVDGKFSYSDVRMLRLDTRQNLITIYPNPVKEGFYISVPSAILETKETVTLNLITTNGQLVRSREITAEQATNYYFNIADRPLAAGNYFLQVYTKGKILGTKELIINP